MSDPAPEHISVSFKVTADEYARYAAAVDRRSRSWTAFNLFVAMVFSAIPVALLLRALAAQRLHDSEAVEIAGEYSLYAFALGVMASWIGGSILTRIVRRRYFRSTVDSPEPRTTELDHNGVTVTSKGTRASYDWAAISHCTYERGLLLMWITSSTAVAIPGRCFGSEAECAAAMTFARARIAEAKAMAAQADAPAPASA